MDEHAVSKEGGELLSDCLLTHDDREPASETKTIITPNTGIDSEQNCNSASPILDAQPSIYYEPSHGDRYAHFLERMCLLIFRYRLTFA